MSLISTGIQFRKNLKNAQRLKTIVGVFAKHGFTRIAEKIKLGRYILDKIGPVENAEAPIPIRLRKAFEELGPTFIKLGQVLASRPDLVPQEFIEEFSKLHDRVQPLPLEVIKSVLKEELGPIFDTQFIEFDEKPLGSASIAQVHRAKLANGTSVVIKVQRPGLIQKINDDLNVLYFIANLLEEYIEESRILNPTKIVNEFFKSLELETNFIVEANNLRRFTKNFESFPEIKFPKFYPELSTERVLTMEALEGLPLSATSDGWMESNIQRSEVLKIGMKCYIKMVFQDGLFHGDLHAGNFFLFPKTNQIGLIDFGLVGRLTERTRRSIATMLLALTNEDYETLAFEYIDISPFNDRTNIDEFTKDLRDLIAPFFGLTLKDVNIGKLLLKSSMLAAKHQLALPAELILFFKSLIGMESLGRRIDPGFDFLKYTTEVAEESVAEEFRAFSWNSQLQRVSRESSGIITALPRQVHLLLRRISAPNYATKIKIEQLEDLGVLFKNSFNLIFLGIVIGSLLLSSAIVSTQPSDKTIMGLPTIGFVGYLIALILGLFSIIKYIRK